MAKKVLSNIKKEFKKSSKKARQTTKAKRRTKAKALKRKQVRLQGQKLRSHQDEDLFSMKAIDLSVKNKKMIFRMGNEVDKALLEDIHAKDEAANQKIYEKYCNQRRILLPIKDKQGNVIKRELTRSLKVKVDDPRGLESGSFSVLQDMELDETDDTKEKQLEDHLTESQALAENSGDALREATQRELVIARKTAELSVADVVAMRERTLLKKKIQMSCFAANIIRNANLTSNLGALHRMLEDRDPSTRITIRHLGMLTLAEVFNSIIPGYEIQPRDPSSKAKLMSNQESMRTNIDETILRYYKKYLVFLEREIKTMDSKPSSVHNVLGLLAVRCMSDMFVKHYLFNCATNMIPVLVHQLNSARDAARKYVFDALRKVFTRDKLGDISYYILTAIDKEVRHCGFVVQDDPIRVLFHLQLSKERRNFEEEERKDAIEMTKEMKKLKKKAVEKYGKKLSKRERREKKETTLLKKYQDKEISRSVEKRICKHRARILDLLFGIFFHILKAKPTYKLLSAVLDGLTIFAHLIDIVFFSNILNVMRGLVTSVDISLKNRFSCTHTVFSILSGQGEALALDPSFFFNVLYKDMLQISSDSDPEIMLAFLKVFHCAFVNMKERVVIAQLLAFLKRLSFICLVRNYHEVIPALTLMRQVMKVHPQSAFLLDADSEGTMKQYDPECEVPANANASSAALWEVVTLQRSYHPHVRLAASSLLYLKANLCNPILLKLLQQPCEETYVQYDPCGAMKFNPAVPEPAAHEKKLKSKSSIKLKSKKKKDIGSVELRRLLEDAEYVDITDMAPLSKFDFYSCTYRQWLGRRAQAQKEKCAGASSNYNAAKSEESAINIVNNSLDGTCIKSEDSLMASK